MINFCVSLTTLPTRIDNINQTLDSINNQSIKPDKIFLNLPRIFKRFPGYKFTEKQIEEIKKKNLIISECLDYGPGTKLMGSLEKIKKYDCVILLDDDNIYHKNTLEILINNFLKHKTNYSYFVNEIFSMKFGQGSDGFLIVSELLNDIEIFYDKYVKDNKNLFLDDDFWISMYLYCEKKSFIKNTIHDFKEKTGEELSYIQTPNKDIDALNKTVHKNNDFLNRRKKQKIEFIKYKLKKLVRI